MKFQQLCRKGEVNEKPVHVFFVRFEGEFLERIPSILLATGTGADFQADSVLRSVRVPTTAP